MNYDFNYGFDKHLKVGGCNINLRLEIEGIKGEAFTRVEINPKIEVNDLGKYL